MPGPGPADRIAFLAKGFATDVVGHCRASIDPAVAQTPNNSQRQGRVSMNQFTHRSPLQVKLLAAAIGSLSMASAYADLNLVPALNPVQASAANVTQTVCPQMAGAQERLTAAQQVLLSSCTKLIVTSNAQQTAPGQGTPGSGSFDLGLTTGGLRDALQAVAPEEMNGLSRARTTNFAKPLNARLLALRKGRAGGVLSLIHISEPPRPY